MKLSCSRHSYDLAIWCEECRDLKRYVLAIYPMKLDQQLREKLRFFGITRSAVSAGWKDEIIDPHIQDIKETVLTALSEKLEEIPLSPDLDNADRISVIAHNVAIREVKLEIKKMLKS